MPRKVLFAVVTGVVYIAKGFLAHYAPELPLPSDGVILSVFGILAGTHTLTDVAALARGNKNQ